MAKRVSRVGHPSAQASIFLGKPREITVDTTNNSIRVHDGISEGGFEAARADVDNVAIATANNHGKMSSTQASDLVDAKADIVTNAAGIAANLATIISHTATLANHETRVGDLETFRGYFAAVTGSVFANQADLNLLFGKSGTDIAIMRGTTAVADPTKQYFYNSVAAPGWAIENPDTNVRALMISNTGGGTIAGSDDPRDHNETVNISITGNTGLTAISIAQLPAHRFFLFANTEDNCTSPTINNGNQATKANNASANRAYEVCGTATDATLARSSSVGSNEGHLHTVSLAGNDNVRFRPRYAIGHIAKLIN